MRPHLPNLLLRYKKATFALLGVPNFGQHHDQISLEVFDYFLQSLWKQHFKR